jgi:hypothetical protein
MLLGALWTLTTIGTTVAQRGRKPTPVVVKRARGSERSNRPLATLVPEPRRGDLICPLAVANNPIARTYWDHFLTNTAPGHLAPVDSPLLAMLCMCLARKDAAEAAMGNAMIVRAPQTGVPMQSPWLPIINRQSVLAERFAAALALAPAERNRLGVHDEPPPGDRAESYFR